MQSWYGWISTSFPFGALIFFPFVWAIFYNSISYSVLWRKSTKPVMVNSIADQMLYTLMFLFYGKYCKISCCNGTEQGRRCSVLFNLVLAEELSLIKVSACFKVFDKNFFIYPKKVCTKLLRIFKVVASLSVIACIQVSICLTRKNNLHS